MRRPCQEGGEGRHAITVQVDGSVASEPVEVKRTTAMRLRGCVPGVAVATMLVVLPNLGCPLVAGEATNQIRTHIDQMDQLVAKTGSTTESREAVQKARRSDVQLERDGRRGPRSVLARTDTP